MVGRLVEHQHVVRRPASTATNATRRRSPPLSVPTGASRSTPASKCSTTGPRVRVARPHVVGPSPDDELPHGVLGGEVVGLAQIANGQARGMRDPAVVRGRTPASILSSVVFPSPLRPTTPIASPSSTPRLTESQQRAGAVGDRDALGIDQVGHQPPMICSGRAQTGDGRRRQKGGLMVDFSPITRPVGRLIATAQNGLEVIRYGGLETGTVPSPFQIVESVPMYRLRRYFPPDNRNGQACSGRPC